MIRVTLLDGTPAGEYAGVCQRSTDCVIVLTADGTAMHVPRHACVIGAGALPGHRPLWTLSGWEEDDDRPGVYFLTIADPDGDEAAVIVHRTMVDPTVELTLRALKEENGRLIVAALNADLTTAATAAEEVDDAGVRFLLDGLGVASIAELSDLVTNGRRPRLSEKEAQELHALIGGAYAEAVLGHDDRTAGELSRARELAAVVVLDSTGVKPDDRTVVLNLDDAGAIGLRASIRRTLTAPLIADDVRASLAAILRKLEALPPLPPQPIDSGSTRPQETR